MNASLRTQVLARATAAASAAERTQWLEKYRRSGLSQQEFARTHGVELGRLRYWLYSTRDTKASATIGPRWQEVQLTAWPSTPQWGAEIRLPDGWTIRLQSELARELVTPLLVRER